MERLGGRREHPPIEEGHGEGRLGIEEGRAPPSLDLRITSSLLLFGWG
jgi:hypothetical protein